MPLRPHEAREYLWTPEDVAAHLNAAIEESDGDPRLLRKVPEGRGLPLLQSNLPSRIVQLPKRNPHQNRRWSFPHPAPRLRRLTELSPLATSWSCGDMVVRTRTAFADPGPGSTLLRSLRLCSSGCRSGSPRQQATTGRVLVRYRPHAHPPARPSGALVAGAPRPASPVEIRDLSSYRGVPLRACLPPVKHPAGRADASPLSSRRRPCCLR